MSWSREQVEVLIDNYQQWPCVYAIRNPLYKNKHARIKAFEAIESAVKRVRPCTSVAEIKGKFQGLKTNFLTEYKKMESSKSTGTGEDDVYVPTLWYFEKLHFVLDHSVPRQAEDSIDDVVFQATDEVEENCTETSQIYDEANNIIYDFTGSIKEGEVQAIKAPALSSPGTSSPCTPGTSRPCTPGSRRSSLHLAKKRNTENQMLAEATTALGTLARSLETPSQTTVVKTNEDLFGELVASKLKLITNVKIRHDIEAKILELVYNAILDH